MANKITEQSFIENLRTKIKGTLLQPHNEEYTKASQAWNLNVQQKPLLVVMAETIEDIQHAVRFANEYNLGIGVMATGHGVGTSCNDGLLINTSHMRNVKINAALQTATVQAGTLWKDVIADAYAHGLAALVGSSPHVGVVGYTLGGGFGYLGRKFGLNAAGIVAADVVCADGNLLHVTANGNADLFWALKGSVGNFGIVTSLEFRLYPLGDVFGGAVYYPAEQANELLTRYAQWASAIPDEITVAFAYMKLPAVPFLPPVLQGKEVVVIKGCYCGEHPEQRGKDLFKAMREEMGEPILDSFKTMQVTDMDKISNDPVNPQPLVQYSGVLKNLCDDEIKTFTNIIAHASQSPLFILELRRLGGALANNAADIQLMGKSGGLFAINAIGITPDNDSLIKSKAYFNQFAETIYSYETNEVFINYMEANPSENKVRSAYTTEDWKKLVQLKTKYDPKNIFCFNRNIPPEKQSIIEDSYNATVAAE